MEICIYALGENTLQGGYHYACQLHGHKIGLDIDYWCEACPDYSLDAAIQKQSAPPSGQTLPCATCRFATGCVFQDEDGQFCPFFSQK